MSAPATPTATLIPLRIENTVFFDVVGAEQWRVLDTREPKGSVAALLGFVRIIAGVYEVTFVNWPIDIAYCTDLRAAHAAFVDLP